MLSSIDRIRHAQIWDLLDQYADIRDHLEDVLYAMQMLQSQLASDIDDLSVDFDDLTEELNNCSKNLIRFKTAPDHPVRECSKKLNWKKDYHSRMAKNRFPFSRNQTIRSCFHGISWKRKDGEEHGTDCTLRTGIQSFPQECQRDPLYRQ